MTNFIFSGISYIYNSVRNKLNATFKRRRDSDDEDEENDILDSCQVLNKRAKLTNEPQMAANNNECRNDLSPKRKSLTKKPQRPFENRLKNVAAKENEEDIIEINDDVMPVVKRAPLSSLSLKVKSLEKKPLNGIVNSVAQAHTLQSHERRRDGSQPFLWTSSFTRPMRCPKYRYQNCRQTALKETLDFEDQQMYSSLLAGFHGSKIQHKEPENSHQAQWQLVSAIKPKAMACPKRQKPVVPKEEIRTPIYIPVKKWQSPVTDPDIEIIGDIRVNPVNSLGKKLSQNSLVSEDWIRNMQRKYDEREREAKRQLEEAKLKADLYSKHYQAKRMEALDERIRKHLQITDVVLDDRVAVPELPELTAEMQAKIDAALRPNPPTEVLVEGFGQMIRRQDIKTLFRLNWLNDEVINFYMNLIIERGNTGGNYRSVYAFNTFFYPKLVSQGYNSLKRWTKKVDIFSKDLLLVPIHMGMHWCMAAIDFKDCSVRYYDSMGSDNNTCLKALLKYLNEESQDKKKTQYDTSCWTTVNVKGIPQQMNGCDCGVFSCMFGEYLSRSAQFTFSQKDMQYFRRKMVYEIISKKLLM